ADSEADTEIPVAKDQAELAIDPKPVQIKPTSEARDHAPKLDPLVAQSAAPTTLQRGSEHPGGEGEQRQQNHSAASASDVRESSQFDLPTPQSFTLDSAAAQTVASKRAPTAIDPLDGSLALDAPSPLTLHAGGAAHVAASNTDAPLPPESQFALDNHQ